MFDFTVWNCFGTLVEDDAGRGSAPERRGKSQCISGATEERRRQTGLKVVDYGQTLMQMVGEVWLIPYPINASTCSCVTYR